MELFTLVHGLKIAKMEKELSEMEVCSIFMRANSSMVSRKVKAKWLWLIKGLNTKANLKMMFSMDKVIINGEMIRNISENGKII